MGKGDSERVTADGRRLLFYTESRRFREGAAATSPLFLLVVARNAGVNHAAIWKKRVLGVGNSSSKGPEPGLSGGSEEWQGADPR